MNHHKVVLFVSHKEKRCGVHEFGLNVYEAIRNSQIIDFKYIECESFKELAESVRNNQPVAIIYNHYPSTLPWLTKKVVRKFQIPQIGIIHEVHQELVDALDDTFFDYYIAPDPTLLLKNPIVFKTGRIVPFYVNHYQLPEIPTIGSFGFGTAGKGFEKIITTVQNEFDEALIRLNIPYAKFGDDQCNSARQISENCKMLVSKPSIKLEISHEFLEKEQVLDFLAQNTINVFFYDNQKYRGISSTIDYALAVNRPIAVTKSSLFRHILSTGLINIENNSLKEIIKRGSSVTSIHRDEWNRVNLQWDYERIVESSLKCFTKKESFFKSFLKTPLKRPLPIFANQDKKMGLENYDPAINNISIIAEDYIRTNIPSPIGFNRILDASARNLYQPVVDLLFRIEPEIMKRKIVEANVQQAFVLDSVYKFAANIEKPKILSIGSYEDTAAIGLQKIGFEINGIDPVLNYDLNTFITKPSTRKESYDIVFSTSVIEHVFDDETFVENIAALLKVNGFAILTCDYKADYKPGDKIPGVDYRLYSQNDFSRLLSRMKNCELIDSPNWECSNPDFFYEGCNYTFASFVVQKKS
jgi:SAM-dependent methyltransferase